MLWFVAFTNDPTGEPAWWKLPQFNRQWVREGFEHCVCYRQLDPRTILFAEPTKTHLDLQVFEGWAYACNRNLIERGATVLAYHSKTEPLPADRPHQATPVTCATVVGYMLGVNPRPLGPWQLFKLLRQRGATEVST